VGRYVITMEALGQSRAVNDVIGRCTRVIEVIDGQPPASTHSPRNDGPFALASAVPPVAPDTGAPLLATADRTTVQNVLRALQQAARDGAVDRALRLLTDPLNVRISLLGNRKDEQHSGENLRLTAQLLCGDPTPEDLPASNPLLRTTDIGAAVVAIRPGATGETSVTVAFAAQDFQIDTGMGFVALKGPLTVAWEFGLSRTGEGWRVSRVDLLPADFDQAVYVPTLQSGLTGPALDKAFNARAQEFLRGLQQSAP